MIQATSNEVRVLINCTHGIMYVPQNLISLQEASDTGQHSTDETGTFYSPTTKLLSTVSNNMIRM